MVAKNHVFLKLTGYTLTSINTSFLLCLVALMFFMPLLSNDSYGHRSGCHRWHSCPSDSGSYGCGDLGYECKYSNTPSNSSSTTSVIEKASPAGNILNDPSPLSNSELNVNREANELIEAASNSILNATNATGSNGEALNEANKLIQTELDSILNAKNATESTVNEATHEEIEMSGPVTHVIDGDTLDVNGITIRLALVDTPEIGENGYESAKNFVNDLCLGNDAQVDIDDGQRGGDRYGREIGVVYCNGVNVNSALIEKQYARIYTDYCDVSEFANVDWAECSSTNSQFYTEPLTEPSTADTQVDESNCDSSYPDTCIASAPPDLDCADVSQKRFTVSGSDPHGFDGDGDGVGCES